MVPAEPGYHWYPLQTTPCPGRHHPQSAEKAPRMAKNWVILSMAMISYADVLSVIRPRFASAVSSDVSAAPLALDPLTV